MIVVKSHNSATYEDNNLEDTKFQKSGMQFPEKIKSQASYKKFKE